MKTRDKRRSKIRKVIRGTKDRPRLVVFRSNKYIYGQVIDDSKGAIVVSVDKAIESALAGKEIAQKAIKKGVKEAVFDRAGYQYHGNIKKFVEAAREAGLKI